MTAEISNLIKQMYGNHYTPKMISNMIKMVSEEVEAFANHPLAERYVCVHFDAMYIALKRDTAKKEAVYIIAIDIQEYGSKEVLSYIILPNESVSIWREMLVDIKQRGAEEILLFISDGRNRFGGASIPLILLRYSTSKSSCTAKKQKNRWWFKWN